MPALQRARRLALQRSHTGFGGVMPAAGGQGNLGAPNMKIYAVAQIQNVDGNLGPVIAEARPAMASARRPSCHVCGMEHGDIPELRERARRRVAAYAPHR